MKNVGRQQESNDRLRQARLNRLSPSGSGGPMSRRELADEVNAYLYGATGRTAGIDANYIGKLERGEHRWPNSDYREGFTRVLEAATDAELGFYVSRGLMNRDEAQGGTSTRTELTPLTRTGPRRSANSTVAPDQATADSVPWRQHCKPEGSIFGHVLVEEVTMAAHESGRFVRQGTGTVDHVVLDQLRADVTQLAVDYLHKPPYLIFRPLACLRREVFDLLDHRQRPAVLPFLYQVAGQLSAMLAHACADLGQTHAADTHSRTAWLCADMAEDDTLRTYIRWVQSNVAYWNGDYRQAAEIARSGQTYPSSGTGRLRLASQEARAWAACHEAIEVERALSTALDERAAASDDRMPGVFNFEAGKATYYSSETRLALGGTDNCRLAVNDAAEAIRLLSDRPANRQSPELVAAAQLDLANAHLALRALDAAEAQLRTVLPLPVASRTQPIVGRMTTADQTLATEFGDAQQAEDLRERIALFLTYPAIHEPPALPA